MRYPIAFLVGLLAVGLLALPLQAQSLTVAQADSLRLLLRANKADTSHVGALLQLSEYYQRRTLNYAHNLDTALVLVNQAKALSQRLKYANGQQEALFQQGRIFIKQEKLEKVKRMLPSVSTILRIRLLLELGKNKLRPTYSQEVNLDSALFYFNQAEQVSNRISNQPWQQESQLLTGVAYLFKQDCKAGQAWFRRVIEARQQAGDRPGELRAWLRWLTTQTCERVCLQDSSGFIKALTLARQLKEKPTEFFLLQEVASYRFSNFNNVKQIEQEASEALSLQKAIGYRDVNRAYHALVLENDYLAHSQLSDLMDARTLVGAVELFKKIKTKEVFYNLEVIKDLERNGLQEDLDWPLFWLGNNYFYMGQHAKSLAYYQQSLAVSHRKGEVAIFAGLIRHMAESLLNLGKVRQAIQVLENFSDQHPPLNYDNKISIAIGFGQCYAALNQYRRAEQYYLKAVALSRKSGLETDAYLVNLHICKFYVSTAQYVKAAPYLKTLAYIKVSKEPTMRSWVYLMQFKVDSAQAKNSSAIRYYQRYIALKDSLINETSTKQMAALDVRYQTRQKEQTLLLHQKDIRLLTQQNHVQQTQRNALIWGTLLLTALLGLGYNRYRIKQRGNQLLQEQQEQINHKNEQLQRLLNEKELLLKEIHHRVKNNLQVVMSLLNSQAALLQEQTALDAIQQSQHRVQAMALIHQKLYQSEGVARIPMEAYIQELVAYLHESYDLPQPIHFTLDIAPIELDVTQAVPLGLIVNEAITNALKYAFPDGRGGRVQVKLCELSPGEYELIITDDGVGLSADFDPTQSHSLGLTLMYGFSEQLRGQLHISSQLGLTIRLVFRDERLPLNS